MPSVPLSFVVAFAMAALLYKLCFFQARSLVNKMLSVFIAVCILQLFLMGLSWNFGSELSRTLQVINASLIPIVGWIGFQVVLLGKAYFQRPWLALHAVPVFLVGFLWFSRSWTVDFVLVAEFIGYGLAFVISGHRFSGDMQLSRVGDEDNILRVMKVLGSLLLMLGLIDLLVAIDIGFVNGKLASSLLSMATIGALFLIAYVVTLTSACIPASKEPTARQAEMTAVHERLEDNGKTIAVFKELMETQQLFKDGDMTLERLARKAGIPSRQISKAINQHYQCNLSQAINQYRIEYAKTLLRDTDDSVTEILFRSGFQTKSNFNREFRRITGGNPSQFRQRSRENRLPNTT